MKKNLKKIVVLVFTFSLLLSFNLAVYAEQEDSGDEVIFEAIEITDLKQLEERIEKQITDDENFAISYNMLKEIVGENQLNTNKMENDIKVVDIKQTNQKIKSVRLSNNAIKDQFVSNSIITIAKPILDEPSNETIKPFAEGSKEKIEWDNSVAIKMKVTLYYNKIDNYYHAIQAKGEVLERNDSSLRIRQIRTTMGSGSNAYDRNLNRVGLRQPSYTNYIRTREYESFGSGDNVVVTASDNYYFDLSADQQWMGARLELEINRGTAVYYINVDAMEGSFPAYPADNRS